jgi:cation-transporting ATPase E
MIANKVGINNIKAIDMSKNTIDIENIVEEYNIFARVTPEEKKEIVIALKKLGHKVAMTGDGVNDVLSLKEADCSIAMASGSDAARNVSEIVLLDSDFKSIPDIIGEGRRSINNLERSASLFLTKTIYAFVLALLFLFINKDYPFIPIQLTLINAITIGIPSFVLALEPNYERVKGKFVNNIITKSLPTALTVVINIIFILILTKVFNIDSQYTSTMCVITVAIIGFVLLYKICTPFNYSRIILFGFLILLFGICVSTMHDLFELFLPDPLHILFLIILCFIYLIMHNLLTDFINKRINRVIK